MKLYGWQEECLEAWAANDYRGIVSAVTGSGKTMLALAGAERLMAAYPDLRIRIVAPTIALANQWRQAVQRFPGLSDNRPGFYGDGIRDEDARIIIYVINSARTGLEGHIRRDFALNRHVLLICDECHRYKSRENHRIFGFIGRDMGKLPLYHCMGLSATPFNGFDDEKLTDVLGREIYNYGLARAASDETISPYYVCQIAAGFLTEEMERYRELSDQIRAAYGILLKNHPYLSALPREQFMHEVHRLAKLADMDPHSPAAAFLILTYQRKEISVLAETRLRCCMDLLDIVRDRGRILIFSERIEQAESIYRLILRKYGNIAGIYHSEMTRDARMRVLEDFRSDHTRILVSCKCLDEGLDVPDASIGIVMSASAVPRQRIQRLGRIIRRSDGKASACLYYIYVKESSDDSAYLPGLETRPDNIFDLRYYAGEGYFANDMYEYAANDLLMRAKQSGMDDRKLSELRKCLLQGSCHPDYLMSENSISGMTDAAITTHERNYFMVMRSLGSAMKQPHS